MAKKKNEQGEDLIDVRAELDREAHENLLKVQAQLQIAGQRLTLPEVLNHIVKNYQT